MKGSILFNKDINIEVDVDPSAEEGARLVSAKNLVDGQEAGGGGGSNYELLAEQDITISSTNTSSVKEATITVTGISTIRDNGAKIIYISIFDKSGMRNGYYYGGNFWATKVNALLGNTYYVKSNGTMDYSGSQYGVYPTIAGNTVEIYSRYISSFGVLDGTFAVRIFTLDYPNDESPFNS